MTTRSVDGTLLERLSFLSSTVLKLDHESRGLRSDSAWPRPDARRVLRQVASDGRVALSAEEVVQVAVGIGIPTGSLTADPGSWLPVESCFRRLVALREQDEKWRVPILGADEEKFPASSSGPETYDMDIIFWATPRCCRGLWARRGQDQIAPRRRRGLRRNPADVTEPSVDVEVLERCASVISDLNESIGHFDGSIRDYLERLETHRGRPIKMRTFLFRELGGGECGVYIPRRTYDEIGFPLDAPHATHIILHEVGHMVLDHAAARRPEDSPLFRSMASITPEALTVYLGRSVYEDCAEREAEAFATCLSAAAASPEPKSETEGAVSDTVALRMRTTFGG